MSEYQYSFDGGVSWEWAGPEGFTAPGKGSVMIRYFGAPVSTPQQSAQRASVDTLELRALAQAWSDAATECWPSKTLECWANLIAHINAWGSAGSGAIPEGEAEYELYEVSGDDVLMVAGTSGKRAYEEILHYAAQYAQDGPIEIHKLVRTKLSVPVAAPSPAPQGEPA